MHLPLFLSQRLSSVADSVPRPMADLTGTRTAIPNAGAVAQRRAHAGICSSKDCKLGVNDSLVQLANLVSRVW